MYFGSALFCIGLDFTADFWDFLTIHCGFKFGSIPFSAQCMSGTFIPMSLL